jgi:hypothetical protein
LQQAKLSSIDESETFLEQWEKEGAGCEALEVEEEFAKLFFKTATTIKPLKLVGCSHLLLFFQIQFQVYDLTFSGTYTVATESIATFKTERFFHCEDLQICGKGEIIRSTLSSILITWPFNLLLA